MKIYKSRHGDRKKGVAEKEAKNVNDTMKSTAANSHDGECVHVQGNEIYLGMDSASPEIGEGL